MSTVELKMSKAELRRRIKALGDRLLEIIKDNEELLDNAVGQDVNLVKARLWELAREI